MLAITRKVGQEVHVGDNIVIKVLEIDRGQVRFGFAAPEDIKIRRPEVVVPVVEPVEELK